MWAMWVNADQPIIGPSRVRVKQNFKITLFSHP